MAWWDLAAWDWSALGKTVIGAGLGSAIVQGLLPLYRENRQRKSQAAYMGSPADLFKTVEVDGPTASITCQSWVANDQIWSRP